MNSIIKSYSSLIENTNYKTSILSNTSSFLNMILEDINWVGFYLFIDNSLILGPFQGNTACTVISLDKGVCGAAARTLSTQRVENVSTQISAHKCLCASLFNSLHLEASQIRFSE